MKNKFILNSILFSLLVLCNLNLFAQNYSIGHKQITFIDPSRNNRSIQTEIYYPATSAGENKPFTSGQFPLLVFGHGFVMAWSSYQWMWDSIVPNGYILAFPRTEGGISPNHLEFGSDLAFLNTFIKNENSNSSSFFYQHVMATSAIMGHSMGGGASFLAAANNTNLTTLINFAAANTTPSSISASNNISVPLLMFIGQNDGVTPPVDHQIPMFDSCSSNCKTRVSILGGGHCNFADYNFNCSFGEGTTSPQPTITRDQQHSRTFYILKPYLDFMLKNNTQAQIDYLNRLINNTNISYVKLCSTSSINQDGFSDIDATFSNPVFDKMEVLVNQTELPVDIVVSDIAGRIILNKKIINSYNVYDFSYLRASLYVIQIKSKNKIIRKLFIKS